MSDIIYTEAGAKAEMEEDWYWTTEVPPLGAHYGLLLAGSTSIQVVQLQSDGTVTGLKDFDTAPAAADLRAAWFVGLPQPGEGPPIHIALFAGPPAEILAKLEDQN